MSRNVGVHLSRHSRRRIRTRVRRFMTGPRSLKVEGPPSPISKNRARGLDTVGGASGDGGDGAESVSVAGALAHASESVSR